MLNIRPAARSRRSRAAGLIFLACGVWLVALGLYFMLLRPPLLPEDPRFIGSTLAQIQSTLPGLAHWLNHVFNVMGGFMIASGVLTAYVAVMAIPSRARGSVSVMLVAGLSSVATMSWTNFAIDSNFKYLLLAPALLWLVGIAAYALDQRA